MSLKIRGGEAVTLLEQPEAMIANLYYAAELPVFDGLFSHDKNNRGNEHAYKGDTGYIM